MKKCILSLAALFVFLFASKVQAQQEGSLWINAITGLNSNWIVYQNSYGNPELEYATTFGFTGGMGVSYFFSDQWGVRGSLLASKLGQNYSGILKDIDTERKVKLSYLEIPVQFMKHIPYAQNPTWISFGPDIMVLFNAQQEVFRKGGIDDLPNPIGMKKGDIRERFNKTDVALSFSLNKMYELNESGNAMFLLSFNTAFGLTDINNIEWKIPQLDGTYTGSHNFYIGIRAELMFKASRSK